MKLIDMDKLIFDLEEKINDGYICTSDELFETIKSMPIERDIVFNWTPCEERLPDTNRDVFVYVENRKTYSIGFYEDGKWYEKELREPHYPVCVLLWMDLPRLPDGTYPLSISEGTREKE